MSAKAIDNIPQKFDLSRGKINRILHLFSKALKLALEPHQCYFVNARHLQIRRRGV